MQLLSCPLIGANCGLASDGCGGVLDCGTCPTGLKCGANGKPGICGVDKDCVPKTCAELGMLKCGVAGDGCGTAIDCGACKAPLTCGGGGVFGVCG